MKLIIHPSKNLSGTISPESELKLPGDKSLSHRAALFASLAQGTSNITNFQVSGVTRVMLLALRQLGIDWQLDEDRLTVDGKGIQGYLSPDETLDCGNSATTMRLLAGAIASSGVPARLDGTAGLRKRPMDRIVDPMQAMGVTIESTLGCAPLNIGLSNYPLHPIEYRLPVASAQVKSCLLITALVAAGPSTFIEPGPSRDHTERMLAAMGAKISRQKFLLDENSEQASHFYYQTRIEPPGDGHLSPLTTRLAGDISSAAFFIVASLITPGSEIVIRDVLLNPTRSGLFDALHAMGADLQVTVKGASSGEPIGTVTARYSNLIGISVSGEQVIRMIDEFPIFAVAAAHAQGTTIVCDAEELRYKETDRISLLCQQLQMLGVKAEILPDGFRIQGSQPLAGGTVSSCGDHRLAMAFTISGLAASSPVTVSEAEYIAESFPQFIPILSALGARVHVVD